MRLNQIQLRRRYKATEAAPVDDGSPQPYSGTIREVNGDGGSAATGILFRDENNNYWTGDATARYTTLALAQTAATAGDTIVCTKAENLGNFTLTKSLKIYGAEPVASHGFIGTNYVHMATLGTFIANADCTIAGMCFFPTSAAITATSVSVTVAMCNFYCVGETGIRLNGTAPEVTSRANIFYVTGTNGCAFEVLTDDATLTSRCDTGSTFTTNAKAAVSRDGYEGATVDVQGFIGLGTWVESAFFQGTLDSWGDTDYDVTTDTSAPGISSTTGVPVSDYMARINLAGSVFYPKSEGQYDKYPSGVAVGFTNDQRTRGQDNAGALESIGFQNVFDTDTAQFDSEIVSGSTALFITSYLTLNVTGEAIMWAKSANYDPSAQTRLAFYARMKADVGGGGGCNPALWLTAAESGTLSDDGYRVEFGRNAFIITRYNSGSATEVYNSATYAMGASLRECYCHVMVNEDGVHFRASAGGNVPTVVDTSGDRHTTLYRAGVGIRNAANGTPRIYNGTFA